MTYAEHIAFFDRELEALGRKPFDLAFRSFVEALAHSGLEDADEACRFFASKLFWPPVSDRVRLELCMRLACAQWWCKANADAEPEEEGKEFLESVLIEYWRDVGRRDWLLENFCD